MMMAITLMIKMGQNTPLDDHNKTGDQKDTIDNPKKTLFGPPLVRTLDVNLSKEGNYQFTGKILSDGVVKFWKQELKSVITCFSGNHSLYRLS